MAHDPQPDLDGKRRLHAVAGFVLLLVVVGFLVIFIATNWRRDSQTDGGGFLGSGVEVTQELARSA
jgi:thiosulfate reductase cytochrome b subunit